MPIFATKLMVTATVNVFFDLLLIFFNLLLNNPLAYLAIYIDKQFFYHT